FQAEDGIRDWSVTGVQTCALPILWTRYTPGSYAPAAPLPKHKSGTRPPLAAEIGLGMQPGTPNNMMTNIEGLYAFGEVNFAYHRSEERRVGKEGRRRGGLGGLTRI